MSLELQQTVSIAGPAILKRISTQLQDRVLKAGARDATIIVERAVKLRLTYSGSGRAPKGFLHRRSGLLVNSVKRAVTVQSGQVVGRVGSDVEYARIQERGGTITGSPWLTIPLPAALTRAGVLRAPARSWPNTFFRKSRAGNLILFQKKRKGIVPLFVLKRQVRIPARRPFESALTASRPQVRQAFVQAARTVT